jgi:hypothetical protein
MKRYIANMNSEDEKRYKGRPCVVRVDYEEDGGEFDRLLGHTQKPAFEDFDDLVDHLEGRDLDHPGEDGRMTERRVFIEDSEDRAMDFAADNPDLECIILWKNFA